ncbi:alpha-L-fucosidase [Mucilaginibacter boryungensis]|uniref:alpha-L-fucosidase n=1 Tax=Mucilaginibacter boryungensis TaxID=768480 RepID=A0ABR9XCD7_9SPHI|nr:alpha-L-fucosidase [Mucilaginibacter boryungensis]MBE9664735.1 alpha-L-fucosidase [Mucilaginibacter boryungensis]
MKKLILPLVLLMLFKSASAQTITQDQRMQWWRDARFGMFIHWGLYSIPAGEWKGKEYPQIGEWIMKNARIPVAEYSELAKQFNPVKFDPKAFVATAKNAGMKYITITSKHHDGFAMFKSNASPFNIVDATPYHKDIIKQLADECHRQGIKICFYYSQSRDWHEPNGLDNDWDFPKERNFQQYLDTKVKPQLTELLTNYGEIGMIWFDTPMSISKDQAQSLKDLVRKLQPACIISGRLGGGVETDYQSTGDNVIPAATIPGDWEVPATLNNTWGYKKNDHAWKSPGELTRLLFDIASKGGNYLLNVGPTSEGVIPEESVKILARVGGWMKVNNEAIYSSHASPFNVEFDWGNITSKPGKLYLGFYNWPKGDFYLEGLKTKVKKIYLLSDPAKKPLTFKESYVKDIDHHRLQITLPKMAPDSMVSVVVMEIDGKTADVEGQISQQNDGSVHLPLVSAITTIDGQPVKQNGMANSGRPLDWNDTRQAASWTFKIEKPGTYNVDLITGESGSHGAPVWHGGQLVKITSGDQAIETRMVPDSKEYNIRAHYWKNIRTHSKTLTFNKPGTYTVSLSVLEVAPDKTAFNFKAMELKPGK